MRDRRTKAQEVETERTNWRTNWTLPKPTRERLMMNSGRIMKDSAPFHSTSAKNYVHSILTYPLKSVDTAYSLDF